MAVTGLDAVESVQPDRHLHAQLGVTQPSQLVAVLQEPDRLAADLDRRGVAPTADLLVEQLVGFRGQRHVHGPDNLPDHTPQRNPARRHPSWRDHVPTTPRTVASTSPHGASSGSTSRRWRTCEVPLSSNGCRSLRRWSPALGPAHPDQHPPVQRPTRAHRALGPRLPSARAAPARDPRHPHRCPPNPRRRAQRDELCMRAVPGALCGSHAR